MAVSLSQTLLTFIEICIISIPAITTTETPHGVIDPTTPSPETQYDQIDIGCNYVNLAGVALVTDKCESLRYAGEGASYIYKCNNNNNEYTPIIMIYHYNNTHCNSTDPLTVNQTDITDYSCQYDDLTNDKCIDNQLNVKKYSYDFESNVTCIHDNNYIEMETQVINKCIKHLYDNLFSKYECNGDQVTVNYYSDNQCNTLLSTDISFTNDECIDGQIVSHSCPKTTKTTTTTPIITTTTSPDEIECDYVNYDGFASRIDICHPAPHKGEPLEFYALQCLGDNAQNISLNWWGSGGCVGAPLQSYPLSLGYDIIDYECSDVVNTCPSSEVLILKIFSDDHECYRDDESYTIVDMVTNKCTRDGTGGSQMVSCHLNGNNDMGYKINKYSDANCNTLLTQNRYSEVECTDGNLHFVVWCNGPNDIQYFDDKCQYHINTQQQKNQRKYLAHALDKCSEFKLAGGEFSNKYVCNAEKNGINQVWFAGKKCQQQYQIGMYEFDANKNNFNCYQERPINNYETCDSDNNLLTVRWYNKDPLTSVGDCIKKKGFSEDNYIITGLCTPDFINSNGGDMVYTMIDCDDRDLKGFEIGFYSNSACFPNSKLHSVIIKDGQCFDGDVVDIIGCKGKGYKHSHYLDESLSSSDEMPFVVNRNNSL